MGPRKKNCRRVSDLWPRDGLLNLPGVHFVCTVCMYTYILHIYIHTLCGMYSVYNMYIYKCVIRVFVYV